MAYHKFTCRDRIPLFTCITLNTKFVTVALDVMSKVSLTFGVYIKSMRYVLFCICYFPIWSPGSGVVLDCIDS